MFEAGDAIVHPVRGAGVVVCIEERQWHGTSDQYYRIKLLGQPGTSLMIPVGAAETIGLRHAASKSKLDHVWRMLRADPENLPADHKARYELLNEKLHAGDVLQVAEAVRDMAWRRKQEGSLTTQGKRIYEDGMRILSGEIAASQAIDMADAEAQVSEKLAEVVASDTDE
jgi:RNA polymerase-interacting CarD/CdnL/TRCF family regulator